MKVTYKGYMCVATGNSSDPFYGAEICYFNVQISDIGSFAKYTHTLLLPENVIVNCYAGNRLIASGFLADVKNIGTVYQVGVKINRLWVSDVLASDTTHLQLLNFSNQNTLLNHSAVYQHQPKVMNMLLRPKLIRPSADYPWQHTGDINLDDKNCPIVSEFFMNGFCKKIPTITTVSPGEFQLYLNNNRGEFGTDESKISISAIGRMWSNADPIPVNVLPFTSELRIYVPAIYANDWEMLRIKVEFFN